MVVEGQVLPGWRDVPVNREMPMSPTVRAKGTDLRQDLIGRNTIGAGTRWSASCNVIRKTASVVSSGL
jgi:hypothetical protein